jgi:hypothetical protein
MRAGKASVIFRLSLRTGWKSTQTQYPLIQKEQQCQQTRHEVLLALVPGLRNLEIRWSGQIEYLTVPASFHSPRETAWAWRGSKNSLCREKNSKRQACRCHCTNWATRFVIIVKVIYSWPLCEVKLSTYKTVEAYKVVRSKGSQIVYTVGWQMVVRLSTLRTGNNLHPRNIFVSGAHFF